MAEVDSRAALDRSLSPAAYDRDRTQSQRPHDKFEGRTVRGDVKWNHLFSDASELEWTTFGHISDRRFTWGATMDPALTSTAVSTSPRDFKVVGTEPRQSWSFKTGPVDQKLTIGGRYVHEDIDYVVDTKTLATGNWAHARDWHFDTNAYAGYVSGTLGFMNRRLEVTPGLRYEVVDTNFDDRRNNSPGGNVAKELLPGMAVGLQATDEIFLFTNAQKSLRPPQVSQVVYHTAVGNEVAWNYEVGTRLTPVKSFDTTFTWFRIDFDNQLEFVSASQGFRNMGETRHEGVEMEANWRPDPVPGLALKAGYTYLDAEQLSGTYAGKGVPYSIHHQFNLGANYKVDGYDFGVDGYYYSAAFSDSANTEAETSTGSAGQIPAYWLWNAQIAKDFAVDGRALTAVAAVNNIFDADYFFRGVDVSTIGRVPGPGRSFILSLKADF